jgi:hypothetical protein
MDNSSWRGAKEFIAIQTTAQKQVNSTEQKNNWDNNYQTNKNEL